MKSKHVANNLTCSTDCNCTGCVDITTYNSQMAQSDVKGNNPTNINFMNLSPSEEITVAQPLKKSPSFRNNENSYRIHNSPQLEPLWASWIHSTHTFLFSFLGCVRLSPLGTSAIIILIVPTYYEWTTALTFPNQWQTQDLQAHPERNSDSCRTANLVVLPIPIPCVYVCNFLRCNPIQNWQRLDILRWRRKWTQDVGRKP
jgi:hypothetical protein